MTLMKTASWYDGARFGRLHHVCRSLKEWYSLRHFPQNVMRLEGYRPSPPALHTAYVRRQVGPYAVKIRVSVVVEQVVLTHIPESHLLAPLMLHTLHFKRSSVSGCRMPRIQ